MFKFLAIIFFFIFDINDLLSLDSRDITTKILSISSFNNEIKCEIKISVPGNWKISQQPEFSSRDANFIRAINIKKISDMEYSGELYFFKNAKEANIAVNFAACSNVCVFANKNFKIDLSKEFNSQEEGNKNIWYMILLAILGGLILNFMPCVLPVLSIKLKSFTKNSKEKRHLLYTFFGILTSFLAFALSIYFLKFLGHSVGWGMHFQNSNFLNVSALLVFMFVLYAYNRISFTISAETNLDKKGEFIREFSSGIIATILAIPCTAPFLGTAATFAIQGTTTDLFIIFIAIALGFGSPYLLAYFMKTPKFIKPGKWMDVFKSVLNLGIVATFLWLIWLLSNHLSLYQLMILILIYTIIFVSAGKYKFVFITASALVLTIPNIAENNTSKTIQIKADHFWYPFNQNAIDNYIKDKKLVFVNITADWCMTCQYNKSMVLTNNEFLKLIKDKNVVLMEGDITYKNEEISAFLRSHNQSGIPFNIIFGPSAPNGIRLSVLPSIAEIKTALEKAQ